MKFFIERADLLAAMQRLSGAIDRKATIPILSHVLIEAGADRLTLRATNLDMEASVTTPARIAQAGVTPVPAQKLAEIAKAVQDGAEIAASLSDGGNLSVTAARAKWRLPTLPASDFPSLTRIAWEQSGEMDGDAFGALLGRAAWAASRDEARFFMGGVRMKAEGGQLYAMATNGAQMAVARTAWEGEDFAGLTIPNDAVAEMTRFGAGVAVTLRLSAGRVGIETPTGILTSKTIAMEWVDRSVPKILGYERTASFTVSRTGLTAAIERARIFGEIEKGATGLRLTVRQGACLISGRSLALGAEGSDEVEITGFDGEETGFGISGDALLSMLGSLDGDEATITFTPGLDTPILVHVLGDDAVQCVSGPMKVA